MSNYATLYCSKYAGVLPNDISSEEASQSVVASAVCYIPLLWLAMFRPADIHEREIEDHVTFVPTATKAVAVQQLQRSIPLLDRCFAASGSLQEHAAIFVKTISEWDGQYVFLDANEIAFLGDPEEFFAQLRDALLALEQYDSRPIPPRADPSLWRRLFGSANDEWTDVRDRIGMFLPHKPPFHILPIASTHTKPKPSAGELQQLAEFLGCSWERAVGWESR